MSGIRRFYRDTKGTKVASPGNVEFSNTTLKLLEYSRASRAFFSDKVLLVEGETDEMFVRFLIDRIKSHHKEAYPWITDYDKIEVIHIGGKANFEPWRKLLEKFNVKTGFLADCDYLETVSSLNLNDIRHEYIRAGQKAMKAISQIGSRDASNLVEQIQKTIDARTEESFQSLSTVMNNLVLRHVRYKKVLEYMKDLEYCKFQKLTFDIADAYQRGTYILSRGDLEDYLGLESKGLEAMYQFCVNDIDKWMEDPQFLADRTEYIGILESFAHFR